MPSPAFAARRCSPSTQLIDGTPRKGESRAGAAAEERPVSEKHAVECLHCGTFRTVQRERTQRLDPGECATCGYLGWAMVADLTEPVRKALRERPLERRIRRLHAV